MSSPSSIGRIKPLIFNMYWFLHGTTRSVAQLKAFNPDQVVIAGVCIIRRDHYLTPISNSALLCLASNTQGNPSVCGGVLGGHTEPQVSGSPCALWEWELGPTIFLLQPQGWARPGPRVRGGSRYSSLTVHISPRGLIWVLYSVRC